MDAFDKYIGRVFDKRYRIEKVIGVGGMAIVFKAEDILMNRTVAIKMLKNDIAGDSEALRRFINESKAVAMLSHENIVNIYDVSVKGNTKYIVMEYIEGITLKAFLKHKGGSLSWRETLNITDRAYLLFEGRILFQGSPDELAVNPIVKEKYLGSNFVLQKKDFQRMAEEKRRKEEEEDNQS